MKSTVGELGSGEAVRGVPEGVEEQLEQLKVCTTNVHDIYPGLPMHMRKTGKAWSIWGC